MAVLHEAFPEWSETREASEAEILRCHTEPHLQVMKTIDGPMSFTGDTPASQTTYRAALLAAGAAVAAVERSGDSRSAPARTPRAADHGDGVLPLQQRRDRGPRRAGEHGVERVAIVDWDVHHGNGTQDIFRGGRFRALRLNPRVAVLPRLGRDQRGRLGRGRARR